MKIRKTILTKIRESNRIKGLLCGALDRSMKSIEVYCDENNQLLTAVAAMNILRAEFPDEEILEEEKVEA